MKRCPTFIVILIAGGTAFVNFGFVWAGIQLAAWSPPLVGFILGLVVSFPLTRAAYKWTEGSDAS